VKGTQHRMECPKCGKVFFSWRPDVLPGALAKCYFCGNQFEDEAARRKPPEPPPAPAAAAGAEPPKAEPPKAEPPKAGEPAG
jgi:hypothetical protein